MYQVDIDIYNALTTAKSYLQGAELDSLGLDYIPSVSPADITLGYIIRYFARQCNQDKGEIIEIPKAQYTHFQTIPLYTVVSLIWRIAGNPNDILGDGTANMPVRLYTGVITANTLSIADANLILPGIKDKLSKITQYYVG
jgi:hypothetical protein